MSQEPDEPINAPLSELRVAKAVRRYERLKLGLMITVLLIDIVIGVYLIGVSRNVVNISRSNHQTLVILNCAVARSTSFDSHGRLRSQEQMRAAFEKCIHQ